jgi:Uma2 family endonuclease
MVIETREITFEEYERLYAGKRYEYVDGRALPMGIEIMNEDGELIVPPPKPQHGLLAMEIAGLLRDVIRPKKLGKLFTEFGFMMQTDPPELRAPDVAFVSKEKLAGIDLGEWLPFPPDLAVEIISEYDRAQDIRQKASSYMAHGTQLLWIVYPDQRIIDVYRPGQPAITVGEKDRLDGADVLPDFSVSVSEIFAALGE